MNVCRWKYVAGSANAARSANVTIKGLLHLLACMRQGLQVHSGTLHPRLLSPWHSTAKETAHAYWHTSPLEAPFSKMRLSISLQLGCCMHVCTRAMMHNVHVHRADHQYLQYL